MSSKKPQFFLQCSLIIIKIWRSRARILEVVGTKRGKCYDFGQQCPRNCQWIGAELLPLNSLHQIWKFAPNVVLRCLRLCGHWNDQWWWGSMFTLTWYPFSLTETEDAPIRPLDKRTDFRGKARPPANLCFFCIRQLRYQSQTSRSHQNKSAYAKRAQRSPL
jgi:hypothetical protein